MKRWQPFEWIVALRFLREGRMQTAFIVGGVAIGVAVIVFMSELLLGLQGTSSAVCSPARRTSSCCRPRKPRACCRPPRAS